MQSNLYVSLSGQVMLERRLTTIATNIANQSVAGYRAEDVNFSTILSKTDKYPVAYAGTGRTHISREAGLLSKTDNPLDVAIQGDGWFAMQTPAGTVYTRDGRMHMQATGELVSVDNHPILDAGNTPLLVDPDAGPITIAKDGMITQNGRQIGAIGLFQLDDNAKLQHYHNSGVLSDRQGVAVLDFTANGIAQGYVESANVNPILELSKLITVSRSFEQISTAMENSESSLRDSIKTLGGA
ncbi:flagellar basal-body rod protein FlgF [Beijerinckia indica]|uniref:Flagellar basal-body rod protein FlgF n=1 Tax=Beijerinckia indica subsp. indica (strain ATCC 9039 / DSM 1715 / NCIMB 8712) TaxID=395963 RepID=B2IK04_BEII9|nr:flagellar basal-body rod protein FlgF [Beijerinckia indica]ACB96379.1 flagellar basal body rod protein [Beijerinckia indica subsp. indica ATCC 9039]